MDSKSASGSISDWIRAQIMQFDWLKNGATYFKSSCL